MLCAVPITELRIEGLRTIEKLRLTLDGLTVLIGDNGTGKSSILEACEILRRATGPRFMEELYGIHGGLTSLLREGAKLLLLGVTVRPPWERSFFEMRDTPDGIEYDVIVEPSGAFASFEERIRVKWSGSNPKRFVNQGFVRRSGDHQQIAWLASVDQDTIYDDTDDECAKAIAMHLRSMLVNLPFETIAAWAARALDRKSALRTTTLLTPADHLENSASTSPAATTPSRTTSAVLTGIIPSITSASASASASRIS